MAFVAHFRALGRHLVSLEGSLSAGAYIGTVRVVDLGLGGARIELKGPGELPRPGDPARLTVELHNRWEPLSVAGKVVWLGDSLPIQLGMAFEHQSGPGVRSLVDLLASNAYE